MIITMAERLANAKRKLNQALINYKDHRTEFWKDNIDYQADRVEKLTRWLDNNTEEPIVTRLSNNKNHDKDYKQQQEQNRYLKSAYR